MRPKTERHQDEGDTSGRERLRQHLDNTVRELWVELMEEVIRETCNELSSELFYDWWETELADRLAIATAEIEADLVQECADEFNAEFPVLLGKRLRMYRGDIRERAGAALRGESEA